MPWERDNIRSLHAYVPGEQPSAEQTAAGRVIKLNTNENAYPPSPAVLSAVHGVGAEGLRLYPPADAAPFRRAAAGLHGLTPQQVIATNGGDELLRLLVTVCCQPTGGRAFAGGLGMTDPSYSLYQVLAEIHDTPVLRVPRGDGADGGFPLPDDYAQQLNAAGCRLAFLVNPHAPSGGLESVDTLRALARSFDGLLVIDEAYIDFAPEAYRGGLALIDEGLDNVIVLRSLSKGYALAGLRFGYGLASAELIATLDKARDSYNLDILAQAAATAALGDQAYARGRWQATRDERQRLVEALRARGFQVPDSHTNFVLVRVPTGDAHAPTAETYYQSLKDAGILIRHFNTPRLADRLRITVGTAEQNDAVLAVLDRLEFDVVRHAPA